jgi:hypothetical protein
MDELIDVDMHESSGDVDGHNLATFLSFDDGSKENCLSGHCWRAGFILALV